MTRIAAVHRAVCLIAVGALAGCASERMSTGEAVVRSTPPLNHESAITNYFDATTRSVDPTRELAVGTPQRGACPLVGGAGGYLGWVVPVEHKTRNKLDNTVTIQTYFFWFSDEVIRGITRRMEVCP